MKRLIIEINYEDKEGLNMALRKLLKQTEVEPTFRVVRELYAMNGFVQDGAPKYALMNGHVCHLLPSKMNVK